MKKLTLTDAYYRGGYWGFLLGASITGMLKDWPGNRIGWIAASLLLAFLYFWRCWRIYKQEQKA